MADSTDMLVENLRLRGRIDELERERKIARETLIAVRQAWEGGDCHCERMHEAIRAVDHALILARFEGTKV